MEHLKDLIYLQDMLNCHSANSSSKFLMDPNCDISQFGSIISLQSTRPDYLQIHTCHNVDNVHDNSKDQQYKHGLNKVILFICEMFGNQKSQLISSSNNICNWYEKTLNHIQQLNTVYQPLSIETAKVLPLSIKRVDTLSSTSNDISTIDSSFLKTKFVYTSKNLTFDSYTSKYIKSLKWIGDALQICLDVMLSSHTKDPKYKKAAFLIKIMYNKGRNNRIFINTVITGRQSKSVKTFNDVESNVSQRLSLLQQYHLFIDIIGNDLMDILQFINMNVDDLRNEIGYDEIADTLDIFNINVLTDFDSINFDQLTLLHVITIISKHFDQKYDKYISDDIQKISIFNTIECNLELIKLEYPEFKDIMAEFENKNCTCQGQPQLQKIISQCSYIWIKNISNMYYARMISTREILPIRTDFDSIFIDHICKIQKLIEKHIEARCTQIIMVYLKG
jgi:hypothetical protein